MSGSEVRLTRGGVQVGARVMPIRAASMHYFDIESNDWVACMQRIKALGFSMVDLPIPWRLHDPVLSPASRTSDNSYEALNRFLSLLHEQGLLAIVRPGPSLNAELTAYGLPERVVWDRPCQARTPRDQPVMVPDLVRMFPMPSLASDAYRDEVRSYLSGVARALAPQLFPAGPIIMAQLGHGALLGRRLGAYEQDYHPDSIRRFREFLRARYRSIQALSEAYREAEPPLEDLRFATISPPKQFEASHSGALTRHLDWVEFQEHLCADAYADFADNLRHGGFDAIPLSCQLPFDRDRTRTTASALSQVVDLVGLECRGTTAANPESRRAARGVVARAIGAEFEGQSCFAAELAAGFSPRDAPLDDETLAWSALRAFAAGVRGYNLHMAVERDRFIGAPISRRGKARPHAVDWQRLNAALDDTSFHLLRRKVPVRIVVADTSRRYAHIMDALGPMGRVLPFGRDAIERCLEDDFGEKHRLAIDAYAFAETMEEALIARGVVTARSATESLEGFLHGAEWIICATVGPLDDGLRKQLELASKSGARVSVGPYEPDGAKEDGFQWLGTVDGAEADVVVSKVIDERSLSAWSSGASKLEVAVHEDEHGACQVLFISNFDERDCVCTRRIGVDAPWVDPFDETSTRSEGGVLDVLVRGRSVRMLVRQKDVDARP